MTSKEEDQARFIEEFARRLKAAAPGERVYMRVGNLFKPADVIDLETERQKRDRKSARDQ